MTNRHEFLSRGAMAAGAVAFPGNTGKRNGPNPDIFDMAFLKARQQQAKK